MDYRKKLMRDQKLDGLSLKPPHRKHIHALAVLSVVIGLVALLTPSHDAEATRESHPPGAERLQLSLALPANEAAAVQEVARPTEATVVAEPAPPVAPEIAWETVEVRSGDSLSVIFDRLKLSPQQLLAVVNADQKNNILTRLRPGQKLHFHIEDSQLQSIRYDISSEKTLMVSREEASFSSEIVEHPVEVRTSHASAVINSSLFNAGIAAGLSDNIIMELANIFGWDVDFALDIRKGDSFTVLYEEQYLDGEKLRDGRILAAEFNNRGRNFKAVLFTDSQGRSQYYTPDGKSMRKAFLRAPVDFHRISSGFQPSRYHPVLGERRPHRGVDYAAPTGTPIRAAGDGRVITRGVLGGYGNTVIIQHGNNITTLYAHMSRFQRGVVNGTRVRQGQVIGYVGMTGLATGPHLHYEFRVNGVHKDPVRVELPDAEPIPAKYRDQFKRQSQPLLAQLEQISATQVATAD